MAAVIILFSIIFGVLWAENISCVFRVRSAILIFSGVINSEPIRLFVKIIIQVPNPLRVKKLILLIG